MHISLVNRIPYLLFLLTFISHHHHQLFLKRPFLPSSAHPLHILSKSSCPYLHISPLPPTHFYRPTPNHLHSYAPHAQTTSIYQASPPQPRSEPPKDYTNPHCASYPSAKPRTFISPSSVPSSPDFADLLSSLPRFHFHMPIHNTLWTQVLYIFPFMRYDAP